MKGVFMALSSEEKKRPSDDYFYSKLVISLRQLVDSNRELWKVSDPSKFITEQKSKSGLFDVFKRTPQTIKDIIAILSGEIDVQLEEISGHNGHGKYVTIDRRVENDKEKLVNLTCYLFTCDKITKIPKSIGIDEIKSIAYGEYEELLIMSKRFTMMDLRKIPLPRTRLYAALLTTLLPIVMKKPLRSKTWGEGLKAYKQLEDSKGLTETQQRDLYIRHLYEEAIQTLDTTWTMDKKDQKLNFEPSQSPAATSTPPKKA